MPLTENTKKAIQYLASIAEVLTQYGDENKGVSQYIGAKQELDNLRELINNSELLSIQEKSGMRKLIEFLESEVDRKLKMFNTSGY